MKETIKFEDIRQIENGIEKQNVKILQGKERVETLRKSLERELEQVANDEAELGRMQEEGRAEKIERYKNPVDRRKLVQFAMGNSMVSTAKKLRVYIDRDQWDPETVPDEILNAFYKLDESRYQKAKNKKNPLEYLDNVFSNIM